MKQLEADQIVKAMQEKKIPVTYVLYPDEGHGFARPENRMSFNAVTEAFLAEQLGRPVRAGRRGLRGLVDHVPGRAAEDVPGRWPRRSTMPQPRSCRKPAAEK